MTKIPRQKSPEQLPQDRIKNFNEVALGFTEDLALLEAERCLNCKNPTCQQGCPVNIDIRAFIQLIKAKKYPEALAKIKETNALPAVCGRVCPQEDQCEKACILAKKFTPINIGKLERFAANFGAENIENETANLPLKTIKKVAVIGSGPAGLTCAADLARKGVKVVIFEALHSTGGVLTYGIPEFRLPKAIVEEEVAKIKDLGVEIKTDFAIGRIHSVQELLSQGFAAVFLGIGAGSPIFLNIPGENLPGVYSANEFLTRVNLMKAYLFPKTATPVKVGNKVVVIGGGNVAMDSARSARRLGAEVLLSYRRTEKEMPARIEEIKHAKEEGIEFLFLTLPVAINADKKGLIKSITLQKMELGQPDASGRRSPQPISGSEFEVTCSSVIVAIGNSPNPLLPRATSGLELTEKGLVKVFDEFGKTSIPNVWAGGDIVTGAATVIKAMGAGKKAAKAIFEEIYF